MREETLVKNILKHQKVIEGMLTAMVGNYTTAEDLFQEVAVILTRKREEATEDCKFVAWARSIAFNVVRDYRKKMARAKVRFLDDEAMESVGLVFEETDEADWDARRQALRKCAEKLPEKERSVLRRRYEEQEPIETLASSMSTSRGAIDTLLYRARKALHHCVESRLKTP
jgi:RNA polymerase sigma-70 factor (ECF subfamily)